jgi:hypothetical protein
VVRTEGRYIEGVKTTIEYTHAAGIEAPDDRSTGTRTEGRGLYAGEVAERITEAELADGVEALAGQHGHRLCRTQLVMPDERQGSHVDRQRLQRNLVSRRERRQTGHQPGH